MNRLATISLMAAALGLSPTVAAWAQSSPSTSGAARAGSNGGSSSITPTQAPPKTHKPVPASAARHRLPSKVTGMGSQAANATGPSANSH